MSLSHAERRKTDGPIAVRSKSRASTIFRRKTFQDPSSRIHQLADKIPLRPTRAFYLHPPSDDESIHIADATEPLLPIFSEYPLAQQSAALIGKLLEAAEPVSTAPSAYNLTAGGSSSPLGRWKGQRYEFRRGSARTSGSVVGEWKARPSSGGKTIISVMQQQGSSSDAPSSPSTVAIGRPIDLSSYINHETFCANGTNYRWVESAGHHADDSQRHSWSLWAEGSAKESATVLREVAQYAGNIASLGFGGVLLVDDNSAAGGVDELLACITCCVVLKREEVRMASRSPRSKFSLDAHATGDLAGISGGLY